MPTDVARVDTLEDLKSRLRIEIPFDVMGIPDVQGPSLVGPPLREELKAHMGGRLTEEVDIFHLPGQRRFSDVRDVNGRVVSDSQESGVVFFVDLHRDANWVHACLYLVRTSEGRWIELADEFPPADEVIRQPIEL